jgi:hypothetical protein
MSKYISQHNQLIEILTLITSNKFIPNYNLLEFKDGIYNIKNNKFLPKKNAKELINNKTATLKYYNVTYKHLKKPET